jgi:hypothetical protein
VEHVCELDLGYPGELADAAARVPRGYDEESLTRRVDLLLKVGQRGRLG